MQEQDLAAIVADLAAEGVYEPGQLVKRHGLSAGATTRNPDGSVSFYVQTTRPNTDRERVEVTVRPVSPY